jgi:hypothetical protein
MQLQELLLSLALPVSLSKMRRVRLLLVWKPLVVQREEQAKAIRDQQDQCQDRKQVRLIGHPG